MSFDHCIVLGVTRTTDLAPDYLPQAESSGMPWVWLVAAIVVIGGIGVAYWSFTRRRMPSLVVSDEVTLEVCRAHGLGLSHRGMLERVSQLAELSHTSEMFLSPQLFDAAVTRASQSKRFGMLQRGLLFEARRCLFE